MESDFQALLFHLHSLFGTVQGEFQETWGAGQLQSRQRIRQSIFSTLDELTESDTGAILDLSHPPRPDYWCVSISHCDSGGGWLATRRPQQIGWDCEAKSRIQLAVIERVSQTKELETAPDPAYLWSAKEAFFKALEDEQPAVLSNLTIESWTRTSKPGIWHWDGIGPRNCQGILIDTGATLLAAALISES